jgi:hypothetical protein
MAVPSAAPGDEEKGGKKREPQKQSHVLLVKHEPIDPLRHIEQKKDTADGQR